jgi:hypothetical protein
MTKRFPRSESDIATLAVRVIDGLTNAAEDFPAPPVSPEKLRGKLDTFQAADTATVAARWTRNGAELRAGPRSGGGILDHARRHRRRDGGLSHRPPVHLPAPRSSARLVAQVLEE